MPVSAIQYILMASNERLTFLAEWNDSFSSINWKFNLFFYPSDGTLELFDILKHRLFLKRTKCDGIELNDIYVGAKLRVCSRLIHIKDYGDSFTRSKFETFWQKTCGILNPEVASKKGEILKIFIENNLKIVNLKTVQLTSDNALTIYGDLEDKSIMNDVINHVTSSPVVVFQLLGNNAVEKLLEITGPQNPESAKRVKPDSLRAVYGIDRIRNGLYVSPSAEVAGRDSVIFFKEKPFAFMKNTTCCVIKPHAVKEGQTGEIMNMIENYGYEITGINMCTLNIEQAELFHEIYKYVLLDYQDMVQELCSGPCIALEIRPCSEKGSITQFRELVGPSDVDLAKILRPGTIRAKMGRSNVQNSVHVTDLIEDATREVECFFRCELRNLIK